MIETHVLKRAEETVEDIQQFNKDFERKRYRLWNVNRCIKYGSARASRDLRRARHMEKFDLEEDLHEMVRNHERKYNVYISRDWSPKRVERHHDSFWSRGYYRPVF